MWSGTGGKGRDQGSICSLLLMAQHCIPTRLLGLAPAGSWDAPSSTVPKQRSLESMQGQGCSSLQLQDPAKEEGVLHFGGCLTLPEKHLLAILLRQIIIKMLEVKATSF